MTFSRRNHCHPLPILKAPCHKFDTTAKSWPSSPSILTYLQIIFLNACPLTLNAAVRVNKHTATLFTFFLSALVHELVMWCIFKKLRGYLLFMQMLQLPLVQLSRTKWMKGRKTLGNINFWLGIFTGPSVLCSLYLIL